MAGWIDARRGCSRSRAEAKTKREQTRRFFMARQF
jgi:hypothetical protein